MNNLKSELIVLSLFDGISCGHLALDRARQYVKEYFASEIDPNAIKVTQTRYPNTKQLGDVRYIKGRKFRGIVNLLIGGSPCKDFSFCGTRKGMITKENIIITTLAQYLQLKKDGFNFKGESYLFWEFVRLLKEIKPKYFLLENVRMTKEWAEVITKALGVDYIEINSRVISGQERIRFYWTNIPYTEIEDHNILLGNVVRGAEAGANAHGEAIPEHLKTPGGYNWKKGELKFNMYRKAYCLTTSRGQYLTTDGDILKFTPENEEELQTIPVGHTKVDGVCDTKRFHLIGNAWTVDVLVEAFFKNLPWAMKMKADPIYFSKKL